jgi:hypothetical protein
MELSAIGFYTHRVSRRGGHRIGSTRPLRGSRTRTGEGSVAIRHVDDDTSFPDCRAKPSQRIAQSDGTEGGLEAIRGIEGCDRLSGYPFYLGSQQPQGGNVL